VAAIAIAFQFVNFGVSFGFLPIYAESLGASKSVVGYITTTGLIATVIGTATAAWMVNRWGATPTVLIAVIATLFSLILMTSTTSLAVLGSLQVLNGYARGLTNTVLISVALSSAPVALRATAMGSYQALYAIGMLAGPAISGLMADAFGIKMVFWVSAVATALGGVLVLIKPLPRR
jgi:MFS family permease